MGRSQSFPASQRFLNDTLSEIGMLCAIAMAQKLPGCREDVQALEARIEIGLRADLAHNVTEVTPRLILAAPLIPVIRGDRHKVSFDQLDHPGIGKGECTTRHSIVSCASQGMPIHFPEEDRLPQLGGLLSGLPQIRMPGDRTPAVLLECGLTKSIDLFHFSLRKLGANTVWHEQTGDRDRRING